MLKRAFFMICFILSNSLIAQKVNAVKYKLHSPNNKDQLVVLEDETGWNYTYHKNGIQVIEKSKLGFALNEGLLKKLKIYKP
jgi:hypothetical protein